MKSFFVIFGILFASLSAHAEQLKTTPSSAEDSAIVLGALRGAAENTTAELFQDVLRRAGKPGKQVVSNFVSFNGKIITSGNFQYYAEFYGEGDREGVLVVAEVRAQNGALYVFNYSVERLQVFQRHPGVGMSNN